MPHRCFDKGNWIFMLYFINERKHHERVRIPRGSEFADSKDTVALYIVAYADLECCYGTCSDQK